MIFRTTDMTISTIPENGETGFYARIETALLTTDPTHKCQLVSQLWRAWQADQFDWKLEQCRSLETVLPASRVGHPEKPTLIAPRHVRSRSMGSPEGRATMLHAVAHIEYNAINLGLDAAYRYRDLPKEFAGGWLRVAQEEVEHFGLVTAHLASLGFSYGDFPAHRGLWDMACKTEHDPLIRMALIPRLFEAHGLDVTPGMAEKFRQAGDDVSVEILEIILREEIGHVALGDYWFRALCGERGWEAESTYLALLQQFGAPRLRGGFNRAARLKAGFTEQELDSLERFVLLER